MNICINGITRPMTHEEEAAFYAERDKMPIPGEPTAEEALTRYANELTGADDPDLISAAETLIEQRIKEDSK